MKAKKIFTKFTTLRFKLTLLILIISLLACGEASVTPVTRSNSNEATDEVVSTVTPTRDVTSRNTTLALPQDVANDDGLIFRIEKVELLDTIEGANEIYRPENSIFLVLKGTFINSTAELDCAYMRDFELQAGDSHYKMSRELLDAAQRSYNLDYPGSFLGQCLNSDEKEASFLIFDIPQDVTNLQLFFEKGEITLGSMADLIELMPELSNVPVESTHTTDDTDSDELINEQIMALKCKESIFMQRLADTSGYIDLEQSSFPNRRVVFKDGYVETVYYTYEKSLEMSARFLRDFPCLETLTVIIYFDGQPYTTQVEINDYEEFLGVNFETLRADIENWRAFLGTIDKPLVQSFANEYITQTSASETGGPIVSAVENNRVIAQ